MTTKEYMIQTLFKVCMDDTIGYTNDYPDNQWWNPPDIDCGALMSYCLVMALRAAGFSVDDEYFEPMGAYIYNVGWLREYCDQLDFYTTKNEPADILVSSGHTEMYLPDDMMGGARNDLDGVEGDGSGREVAISEYKDTGWRWIFRLKEKYNVEVNDMIPDIKYGDDNNTVLTFKYIMKYKLGYDKLKLTTKFDTKMEYNVKHYQQDHGLEPDGIIGAKTRYSMISETGYEEP